MVDRRRRPPDDARVETAAGALRLLGDPTRLRLMWALCESDLDVTTLAERTGTFQTSVSQNLAHLRRAGLVNSHRAGRHVVYHLRDPHLAKLIAEALRHAKRMNAGGLARS